MGPCRGPIEGLGASGLSALVGGGVDLRSWAWFLFSMQLAHSRCPDSNTLPA